MLRHRVLLECQGTTAINETQEIPYGYASIEALMEGQRNIMVGISNDEIVYVPIQRAVKMDKPINKELIDVLSVLSL